MKFQNRKHSCGPAALHNALEALGFSRSEDELAALCQTTSEGTSEVGIKRAAKALDRSFTTLSEKRFKVANLELFQHLYSHGTAVICINEYSHWVAVVGLTNRRYIVVDSADNNLVLFWDEETLEKKWAGSGNFYGILFKR